MHDIIVLWHHPLSCCMYILCMAIYKDMSNLVHSLKLFDIKQS